VIDGGKEGRNEKTRQPPIPPPLDKGTTPTKKPKPHPTVDEAFFAAQNSNF